MNQEAVTNNAKMIVREYLGEGVSMDWLEAAHPEFNDPEEMSDQDYDNVMDAADDLLRQLALRLDTALSGRR